MISELSLSVENRQSIHFHYRQKPTQVTQMEFVTKQINTTIFVKCLGLLFDVHLD